MKRFIMPLLGLALFAAMLVPRSADALTVSPPWFDYQLNPGDVQLGVINMTNEEGAPITIYPILANFTSKDDEGGAPDFYPADENPYGQALAPWITVDPTPITIEPGKRVSVPFSINVPADGVQPGGHYGAIMLSTQPPDVQSGIGVGQQVGALILIRVAGDVREVGRIAEFGYENPEPWYRHLPVDFFLRFENSGNTHLRPVGNLFIKNWYGRQVAALPVNEGFNSVLPNSIRRFRFGWQLHDLDSATSELKKEWSNFAFGKYTATLVITYGANNNIVTEERVFYVWPWQLLSILGGAVIVALILLWLLKRAYEHSVISSYERRKKASEKQEKAPEEKK